MEQTGELHFIEPETYNEDDPDIQILKENKITKEEVLSNYNLTYSPTKSEKRVEINTTNNNQMIESPKRLKEIKETVSSEISNTNNLKYNQNQNLNKIDAIVQIPKLFSDPNINNIVDNKEIKDNKEAKDNKETKEVKDYSKRPQTSKINYKQPKIFSNETLMQHISPKKLIIPELVHQEIDTNRDTNRKEIISNNFSVSKYNIETNKQIEPKLQRVLSGKLLRQPPKKNLKNMQQITKGDDFFDETITIKNINVS